MARRAVEDLRNFVKSVRDRSFLYEKRESDKRNWSSYDDAQVNEIANVLETIRDVVDMAASEYCKKTLVWFSPAEFSI